MQSTPCAVVLAGALVGLLSFNLSTHAADWPRWLGPNGNNIAPDAGAFDPDLSRWTVAWKSSVGLGYSTITIAEGKAYTMGHDGKSQETVYCMNAATGDVLWKHSYDAELLPRMHPGGPNASPTVVGNRVLTVGKDGQVFCFATRNGDVLWQAKLDELMGVELPEWGFASSPVIHRGRVLFSGGKAVALELDTGKCVWLAESDHKPAYTTPVVFERKGKELIAALDGDGLAILSASDGTEIARSPFKSKYDMTATTPTVFADGARIFISANNTAEMLGFDGQTLSNVWSSKDIKNTMNNSVLVDGVLYGVDGSQGSKARFVAVNAADGAVKWAKDGFGYGTVIGVGKVLLALTESGELVTLTLNPEAYSEISRLQILGKTCWTNPILAENRIYVRNNRGDVVCLAQK